MDNIALAPLGRFTPEGTLTPGYGESYLFLVGRDDVHGILIHMLGAENLGLICNSYGYDDPDINDAIMAIAEKKHVTLTLTFDESQANGPHEKSILDADARLDPVLYANSFAIGQSATHQILHTKGGVLLGQGIWWEGSTNLSASGEGTGVSLRADVKAPVGFKAQSNTLMVSANPVGMNRFLAKLQAEHAIAKAQMLAKAASPSTNASPVLPIQTVQVPMVVIPSPR